MLGMILTFIKPFNAALIGFFLWTNHPYLAALWIFVLMICDIADGVVFRRSSWATSPPEWWKSKFGITDLGWFRRVCDVVGDRIAVEFCLILTIVWYQFPWQLYCVELVRDLFLLTIWLHGKFNKKITVDNPNLYSRISMFAVGLMGMFWLLDLPTLAFHTVWFVIGFGLIGIFFYLDAVKTIAEKTIPLPSYEVITQVVLMIWGSSSLLGALVYTFTRSITVTGYVLFGYLVVICFATLCLQFYFRRHIEDLESPGFIWKWLDKRLPRYSGELFNQNLN